MDSKKAIIAGVLILLTLWLLYPSRQIKKIDDPRELVRGDALSAIDFAAVNGSPEAVKKIEQVRKAEEGRAIWNHVKERALSTQARLAARK